MLLPYEAGAYEAHQSDLLWNTRGRNQNINLSYSDILMSLTGYLTCSIY